MRLSRKNTNRGVFDVLKADWIGKNMDLTLLKTVHLCVCIAAFTASAQTRVQLAEPLEWLYPDSKTGTVRACAETDVPANGVAEVNVLLNGLKPGDPVSFSSSAEGGEWFRLAAVPVEKNTGPDGFVENIEKGRTNLFVTRRAPFEVFDAMEPLAGGKTSPRSETMALRFRLRNLPPGVRSLPVELAVSQGGFRAKLPFRVNIHKAALPPIGRKSFKFSNWMDWYGAMRCHGVRSYWLDRHFDVIGQYMDLAAYARQNVIGVPMFVKKNAETGLQEPNEKLFVKFVELAKSKGFAYFEGPLLCRFGEGGWKAKNFKVRSTGAISTTREGAAELARTASLLAAMVERNGWKDVWYQHVSDEPSDFNISEYRITVGIVRKHMPGIKLIDTIENPDFAGSLDVCVPKNFKYENDKAKYEALRTLPSDEMWCYTCINPGGKWLNRLLDQEVLRSLYLPLGCHVHSLDGYLHWGFNRYAPGKTPFDPGFQQDGPAGDRNLVYPSAEGPWPSVRLEAMRQGIEDLELLRMLKRRNPERAAVLCGRIVRGFCDYTADVAEYRSVRKELLEALSE